MTSIPKPGISQPTILHRSVSVQCPGSPGEAARRVHLCRNNLPTKPPTSNPALTSNLESGNFKHKQTSLPQTTSGAVPKEAGLGGPQLGTRASLPFPAPQGLLTEHDNRLLQARGSNPGGDKTESLFGLADGSGYPPGPAETLPRSTAELANSLHAISTPVVSITRSNRSGAEHEKGGQGETDVA